MLIQEVILEDFMSYEYARVPFKSGVNVVCGPNGSGKSSLLLAVSVALGQSYTERSRRLSDLIRWGKDQARVTLVLDNTQKGRRRPVAKFKKDQIFLTRGLRRDGKYWFELENRAATKAEVERLLTRLGVDPDNMLIIMHQNMVEQFTLLSQQEKLLMVEAAVGLESYRKNVLKAQKKLMRISSQKQSIGKLLGSAEQTLQYWREQYNRYQEKKQLLTKRRFLERELAWAEAARREKVVNELEAKTRKGQEALDLIESEAKEVKGQLQVQHRQLEGLRSEWEKIFDERLFLEREKARSDSTFRLCQHLLEEAKVLEAVIPSGNPSHLVTQAFEKAVSGQLKLMKAENLSELISSLDKQLPKLNMGIDENKRKMSRLEEDVEKVRSRVLDNRIKSALLLYREEETNAELDSLSRELKDAEGYLDEAIKKAEQTGSRIAVVKSFSEILDEIRVADGHLAALSNVSEDIERMYESYSKLYLELKEKARLVAENREKALEEVEARIQAWRTVIQNLLDQVHVEYQRILSQAQAVGEVRLVNGHDIEAAGLGILVGFKAGKPVPLDAYTQSGGERTTATISFLLALQQHVRSPFRAVDEYDIHMDPKNRETIAKMLISTVKDADVQYVVLTPSQITFAKEVNIITVQSIEGKSMVREVA